MISRRDYYGTLKDWLIWGPLIFIPPILMLFALSRYQLVDQSDPAPFRAAGLGYAAFWLLLAFRRGKAVPWGKGALVWVVISVVSIVGFFLGVCAFLFGNAILDHGPATESVRIIDGPENLAEYRLMSERGVITGERLQVSRGTRYLPHGSRVILTVRPGFFRSPWIAHWRMAN